MLGMAVIAAMMFFNPNWTYADVMFASILTFAIKYVLFRVNGPVANIPGPSAPFNLRGLFFGQMPKILAEEPIHPQLEWAKQFGGVVWVSRASQPAPAHQPVSTDADTALRVRRAPPTRPHAGATARFSCRTRYLSRRRTRSSVCWSQTSRTTPRHPRRSACCRGSRATAF